MKKKPSKNRKKRRLKKVVNEDTNKSDNQVTVNKKERPKKS